MDCMDLCFAMLAWGKFFLIAASRSSNAFFGHLWASELELVIYSVFSAKLQWI